MEELMKTIYAIYFYADPQPYGYYDDIDVLKETVFEIIKWMSKHSRNYGYYIKTPNYIKTPEDVDLNGKYSGFYIEKIVIHNKLACSLFKGMDRKYFLNE